MLIVSITEESKPALAKARVEAGPDQANQYTGRRAASSETGPQRPVWLFWGLAAQSARSVLRQRDELAQAWLPLTRHLHHPSMLPIPPDLVPGDAQQRSPGAQAG